VEYATLEWAAWFNTYHLLTEPLVFVLLSKLDVAGSRDDPSVSGAQQAM
jgi:hypothetical protein